MIRRNCFLFREDQERWVHGGDPDSKGFGLILIQILVASLMPWLSYCHITSGLCFIFWNIEILSPSGYGEE